MSERRKGPGSAARPLHALIIEDEVVIAMLIEDVLRDAGAASITIAGSEAEAIDAARALRPDFITADHHLSNGSGPAEVDAIRREHGTIPTLYITAFPQLCLPCGPPAAVMGKPFRCEDIVAQFVRLTARPG